MTVRTITARNVNHALVDGLWYLKAAGIEQPSRNGPVLRAPGPVITHYKRPWERLCMDPKRDANHVFHLMETIWMLAGENDVSWLLPFNSAFGQYAEDDKLQHGAYGFRWLTHFGVNQIQEVLLELEKPNTRRAVISMWDPKSDLGADKADLPCNTHIYFEVLNGKLNMSVCCRSNDMIWGAYGANAVHFSMLQELLALELDLRVGSYYQFSNNFHIYTQMGPGPALLQSTPTEPECQYAAGMAQTLPLLGAGETIWEFIQDCEQLVCQPSPKLNTFFMRRVARPLRAAYLARKEGLEWRLLLDDVPDCDWLLAFRMWAARRGVK